MNLGTIVTAMVTPFDTDGSVDTAEAARLARWLIDRGNDGVIVAGSTGEGQALDAAERASLCVAIKDALGDGAAVWANAGSNDTRASVKAVEEAAASGADAILAVVPYYNRPTQRGMIEHFSAIARSTALPVVIYNIPGRTAANMLPETLLTLAQRHANIVGVKESSGDVKQIATIVRDRPLGFIVWAGDDHLFLPCLAIGADGLIGVATHLCSPHYRRMYDAYRAGRVAEAAKINAEVLSLIDAIFTTTNPIPIKWAMRKIGFRVGQCRLPLDALPDSLAERLRPLLATYVSAEQRPAAAGLAAG